MVMPIRPTVAAAQAIGGALAFGMAVDDEIDPGDAEREPAHCRGVTRSPRSRSASVEVRIGCRLTTSAANPAGSL